jgi:hypothetical protein
MKMTQFIKSSLVAFAAAAVLVSGYASGQEGRGRGGGRGGGEGGGGGQSFSRGDGGSSRSFSRGDSGSSRSFADRHDRLVEKAARREHLAEATEVHRNRLAVSPKVGPMKHADRVEKVAHSSVVRTVATKAAARQSPGRRVSSFAAASRTRLVGQMKSRYATFCECVKASELKTASANEQTLLGAKSLTAAISTGVNSASVAIET